MEDVQVAHLAGVFDAVGTATVHVTKNQKYSIGFQFQPTVRLQRPATDGVLMGKLTAYAEEQGVRYHVSEKSQPNSDRTSYEFVVNDAASIERFLTPLMPYLVSKFQQVDLLLDIIPAVKEGKHKTREGFLDLMDAADAIRAEARHGPEPKYTKTYFEEEWGEAASA